MPEKITKILKRSGDIVDFDVSKISSAIIKAMQASGEDCADREGLAEILGFQVLEKIGKKFHYKTIPAVEEVQDVVEETLIENKLIKTAKSYILYRDQRRQVREINQL